MATFIVTREKTGESKEVELKFVEKPIEIKRIECTTVLDQGSDNQGRGGSQDGFVYDKTYEFKVAEYVGKKVPTANQINGISWEYAYYDDSGSLICSNAEKSGDTFELHVSNLDMCGREIFIYAYEKDKNKKAKLTHFCHNRFRWFDRAIIELQIRIRAIRPWEIDQNNTPLCGMVCILYAMIKFDPRGYEKFALDLHRKGEASYNNYLIKPEEQLFEKRKGDQDYPIGGYFRRRMPEIDWITLVSLRNNEKKRYDGIDGEQASGINWPWVMKHLSKDFLKVRHIEKEWRPVKNFSKKNYEILNEIDALHNSGYVVFILCDGDMIEKKTSLIGFVNHWVPYMGKVPDVKKGGFFPLFDVVNAQFSFKVASWGTDWKLKQLSFNVFNTNYYGYIAVKK